MGRVRADTLPDGALLDRYRNPDSPDDPVAYTDCFVTDIGGSFGLVDFVQAFYTTWVFRLERVILAVLAGRPSNDEDVRRLADGDSDSFAAWTVEDRADNQLLMCDFRGQTRSWFMVERLDEASRLYFGSAVMLVRDSTTGEANMARPYRLLLGFHRVYSRVLLASAARRMRRSQ